MKELTGRPGTDVSAFCPSFSVKMKEPALELSPRLDAAAALVRPGARLVDVGTDHAHLPAFLASAGKIEKALATDVADGPVKRARATVARCGLEDVVAVRKAPGLSGAKSFDPTDIVIAGMGGELISAILEEARGWLSPEIRLILQPMTKEAALRAYLARKGFAIEREEIVPEGRRLYTLIVCRATGAPYALSPLEELIGPRNLEKEGGEIVALLEKKLKELKRSAEGKERGGVLTDSDRAVISALILEMQKRGVDP